MAIEKRGADTYRIGFQMPNADGTYKLSLIHISEPTRRS